MTAPRRSPGLCDDCRHARTVTSGRGSTFLRCGKHDEDPRFSKYPPLPVLRCDGHELEPAGRRG